MPAFLRYTTISLIVWLLLCIRLPGQQSPMSFVRYSTADGLADHSVLSMLQDSDGYMWLGTREGLSRFDGTQFRNFFNNRADSFSLPGNYVSALFETSPGKLLLLCDNKVTEMDTRRFQCSSPASFSAKKISAIHRGEGEYFFSSKDTCFVADAALQIRQSLVLPGISKGAFVHGSPLDAARWLVYTDRDFFIFNRKSGNYTLLNPALSLPVHQRILRFLHFDRENGWLFFSNFWTGLYAVDTLGKVVRKWNASDPGSGLLGNDVSFLIPAREGGFWAGSIYGGLAYLSDINAAFRSILPDDDNPLSLPSKQLLNASYDRYGNLWLATVAGIARYGKSSGAVTFLSDRLTGVPKGSVMVKLVKGADGRIYTGAYSNTIALSLNGRGEDPVTLPAGSLMQLWDISRSGGQVIFSGAGKRLAMYDTRSKQFSYTDFLQSYFPASDLVVLSYRDRRGDHWYSGNNRGGLVRVPADGGSPVLYKGGGPEGKFSAGYYSVCTDDKEGNLWFGVNKSARLLKWNRADDRFQEISFDTVSGTAGLNVSVINDLEFDGKETLWIGTDGGGLIAYNLHLGTARLYTMDNGLQSNFISSVTFDDRGRLWAGTLKGLNCLLPGGQYFAGFTKRNGLPVDYFSEPCILFDSSSRRLWLGSNNTLLYIHPDSLLNATVQPMSVLVDEWLVNDQLMTASRDIALSPRENRLIFRYVAVDINGGTDVEYAYQLEGFNNGWVYAGTSREARFMDMPAGTYRFRVRARHAGSGDWYEMAKPVTFVIAAPWYKKRVFILAVFLLLLASLVLIIRSYLNRRLYEQKKLLEKELAVEQERIRMARELHDGLGSMLSGIKHSLSAIGNEAALTPEQHIKFDFTVDQLDESIKDLRAVSHGMFSAELLQQGLEAALSNYCSATAAATGLQITFECIGLKEVVIPGEQAFQLFRIVQELLQNVVRHAQAATAIVQLSFHEGLLALTVEDNGKGFDVKQLRAGGGIGLKNVQSRVRILHGKLDIQSQSGRGTSVLVEIPLQ